MEKTSTTTGKVGEIGGGYTHPLILMYSSPQKQEWVFHTLHTTGSYYRTVCRPRNTVFHLSTPLIIEVVWLSL